jgi:predicted nicotinamide N-methyase
MPIADKYQLAPTPVRIAGTRLDLLSVSNWDDVIDGLETGGAASIGKFPFWIKLWEAAFVLAHELVRLDLTPATRILEIGAGMGVTGLCLAARGYPVTLTDFDDDALELLLINAQRNRLDTAAVEKLDWRNPTLEERFEVICGSEVIYRHDFFNPMIALFDRLLAPAGRVVLAHSFTHTSCREFFDCLPPRYTVATNVKVLRSEAQRHRILIATIRPRRG